MFKGTTELVTHPRPEAFLRSERIDINWKPAYGYTELEDRVDSGLNKAGYYLSWAKEYLKLSQMKSSAHYTEALQKYASWTAQALNEMFEAIYAARYHIYTVKEGDSLPALAKKYLGDSERHLELFALNKDIIEATSGLKPGQRLRIPDEVRVIPQRSAYQTRARRSAGEKRREAMQAEYEAAMTLARTLQSITSA